MIRTGQKHVPWLPIVLLCTTSGFNGWSEGAFAAPVTFLLRRFKLDPFEIVFVGSIGLAFNFLVSPYVSWKSDRIWTRFGRRKPFMVVGFLLMTLVLIAAPLAPKLWMLVTIIALYNFAQDLAYNGPWSPLFMETLPSSQRGRGVVIRRVTYKLFRMYFNLVLLAQYEHVYRFNVPASWLGPAHFEFTGVYLLFFTVAAGTFLAALNLTLNVKETKPEVRLPAERFTPFGFVKDTFGSRQWLMIYLLLFCVVAMGAGLGNLDALLIKEQFGWSMERLAAMGVIATLFEFSVIVPLAMFLADRVDRLKLFRVGLYLSTLHALIMWLVPWLIGAHHPGAAPSFYLWMGLVLAGTLVDHLADVAVLPFFYDLCRRDQMGTMNSGFLVVSNLMRMLIAWVIGAVTKYYSYWIFGWGTDKWDYTGGFLVIFVLDLFACAVLGYFTSLYRRGLIINYAKLEAEQAAAPAIPPQA